MRIEERPVVQNPKTEKVYIASDNQEFKSEKACLKHEELIALKDSISHIPCNEIDVIDSLCGGKAYYITNEKDYELVAEYYCKSYPYGYNRSGNWEYNGVNWYVFHSEDGGSDYRDTLYCYDRNHYKKLIDDFLNQFQIIRG